MEEKAQGNLEYLLIIIAGITIVTLASIYVKTTANDAYETLQSKKDANT